MNDWPADPKLDASLRRLVDSELADARADDVAHSRRLAEPVRRGFRARTAAPLAGVGLVLTAALSGTLLLMGTAGAPGTSIARTPVASPATPSEAPETPVAASPAVSPGATKSLAPGTFTLVGDLGGAIMGPAYVLADGRVYITEIATTPGRPQGRMFDPATGKLSDTGAYSTQPSNYSDWTVTRLADGRFLFAGGSDSLKSVASAGIYDPVAGRSTPTGSMTKGRVAHTATLLADGRVLISGGAVSGYSGTLGVSTPQVTATAELYDPKTGTFTATGSMTVGRTDATAVRLSDGRVLIAGGNDASARPVASAEVFDPGTGRFGPTGSMITPLSSPNLTPLPSGLVLVSAGVGANSARVSSLETYDPATGRFTDAGVSDGGRAWYSVAVLHDGRVLLAGGVDAKAPLATCAIYNPATRKVTPVGPVGNLTNPTAEAVLNDGRVLLLGPTSNSMYSTAWLYQP